MEARASHSASPRSSPARPASARHSSRSGCAPLPRAASSSPPAAAGRRRLRLGRGLNRLHAHAAVPGGRRRPVEVIHFYQAKQSERDGEQDASRYSSLTISPTWRALAPEQKGARILVLDPFVAMIPPSLNAHRDQHMRRAIAPLAHLAHQLDAVVPADPALEQVPRGRRAQSAARAPIGFGAAARSVLLFAPSPDDPDGEAGNQRILALRQEQPGPQGAIAGLQDRDTGHRGRHGPDRDVGRCAARRGERLSGRSARQRH